MKRLVSALLLSTAAPLTAQEVVSPSGMDALSRLEAEASNRFAISLYAALAPDSANIVLSPFSIFHALAIVHEGARGATADQMQKVLHLTTTRTGRPRPLRTLTDAMVVDGGDDGPTLRLANSVWAERSWSFHPEYLDLARSEYAAPLHQVDFKGDPEGARVTINRWVSDHTEDRIPELLKPTTINSWTRLVIANAVWLEAAWTHPFAEDRTEPAPFTRITGDEVEVPMMRVSRRFGYLETDGVEVLELPYAGRELAMVVVLPRVGRDLLAVEASLTAGEIARWCELLTETSVEVFLPRFEVRAAFNLADTVRDLGMRDAFDPEAADFSGISPQSLFISEVVHEAWLDLDEKGTEAAAATAVALSWGGVISYGGETRPTFRADRPFLFFIRHQPSGALLFMGRVTDPTVESRAGR